MKINDNFFNIGESYLFYTIEQKIKAFTQKNPNADIIKMGIGDVTLPLCDAVTEAMQRAVKEQNQAGTFRGYGPYQGYDFLREKIMDYYRKTGVALRDIDEIFVSDGAKSDIANILDIFSAGNTALIPDPVYPVYLDTNIMAGNTVKFIDAVQDNNFLPLPDYSVKADLIYLCSPNNPTGAVYDKSALEKWVDYALKNDAVILYDAAYEAYIQDDTLPRSIFLIDGAEKCAIEFCSFSKTAGFTGTRCGYTIVPKTLERGGHSLNKMWQRRQTTKFNGVPYVVQRGAEAVFTDEGQAQIKKGVGYYMQNARELSRTFSQLGIWHSGGINSPYIWFKCPQGQTSWEFFDMLLEKSNVVGTPGSGFGKNGEGFFRMTAFATKEKTLQACARLKEFFEAL
jgi:LL-diaminopimelate aminotransferase